MKQKLNPVAPLITIILFALVITGCSSGPSQASENDAGRVALCDLSDDLIGWRLTTSGEITFIDLSPPDGVYLELADGGCGSEGFIHNDFWDTFDDELQQSVALGNRLSFEGILTRDGGNLLVSIQNVEASP
jgi:hypothetical protein